jgi:hypothetical protein
VCKMTKKDIRVSPISRTSYAYLPPIYIFFSSSSSEESADEHEHTKQQ